MAGYCIELYKYMRIDENQSKKERLLERRKDAVPGIGNQDRHEKFLAFGEFDRIGFSEVKKFSKFRDVSESARSWIGDRQMLLVYHICEGDFGENLQDRVFYQDGNFLELKGNEKLLSEQLFVGISILQFKDSQKENKQNMKEFLCRCKKGILRLVSKDAPGVRCSVLGTLGSFGLTILWLSDQYVDILDLITKIKNTDVGSEEGEKKAIFLSAYTIFARNHRNGDRWEEKIQNIKGQALLHMTLKKGIVPKIIEWLEEKKIKDQICYHCAGEYDIVTDIQASTAFSVFESENVLDYNLPFFKENILQSNLQLCEELSSGGLSEPGDPTPEEGKISSAVGTENRSLPELENIQEEYLKLRGLFVEWFPSTAGMVDTLDLLYSDYISKISIASNEMWADIFSHQILRILECISKFIGNLDGLPMKKKDVLKIINDLLSDFERQIAHIAESNNLVLGTPDCQMRCSGQNNLALYAYFGVVKRALEYVYGEQNVNFQAEIVPLIVADIVPIIQSSLFIDYENHRDSRVVTFNLPMMSLYNPVCYYPYLYHELYHYVAPGDRCFRNEIYGSLIMSELLLSLVKVILTRNRKQGETGRGVKTGYCNHIFHRYVCAFVFENYEKCIGVTVENTVYADLTYEEADRKCLTAGAYIKKLYLNWIGWVNAEEKVLKDDNPIYLFFCYLHAKRECLLGDLKEKESQEQEDAGKYRNFRIFFKQVQSFLQILDGIAGEGSDSLPDTKIENFHNVMSDFEEEDIGEAESFINGVREAAADIAMIASGNMNVGEFLLLFTKTKKDLMETSDQENRRTQDIVRTGMVLDYLVKDKQRDDTLTGVMESSKAAFVEMYCGFYYSAHKASEEGYWDVLFREAEDWFIFWQECCRYYVVRYRIYLPLLLKVQEGLLVSGEKTRSIQRYVEKDSVFWKQYAEAVRDLGACMRSYAIEGRMEEQAWKEKVQEIDERIFGLNIQMIHHFQYQSSFQELDEKRKEWGSQMAGQKYVRGVWSPKMVKIPETRRISGEITERNFSWKYKAGSAGVLEDLIAEITGQLQTCGRKVLGDLEYPVWYRGQQSSEYKLLPSLMRKYGERKKRARNPDDFSLLHFLREEFEEFKFRADGTYEAIDRVGYTDSDYIALMQHYSVASNFLDWTEDALSALYFALEGFIDENAGKTKGDAALYVFSPSLYNFARNRMLLLEMEKKKDTGIPLLEEATFDGIQPGIPNLTMSYNDEKYRIFLLGDKEYGEKGRYRSVQRMEKMVMSLPMAVYVSRLNKRIQAQSGIFVAYNIYTSPDAYGRFDFIALEEVQSVYLKEFSKSSETFPFLYKIVIDEGKREEIAKWVKAFGMSKEKCYPELQNIGERIMRR